MLIIVFAIKGIAQKDFALAGQSVPHTVLL
jgi:hypothetical protein